MLKLLVKSSQQKTGLIHHQRMDQLKRQENNFGSLIFGQLMEE